MDWEQSLMEAPTSADALRLAGLDWKVVQEPVYTGNQEPIKGYKANVRSSDRKVLGVVSDRYRWYRIRMRSALPMNCLEKGCVMRQPDHCRREGRYGSLQDCQRSMSLQGSGSAPIWYFLTPMTVPVL